MYISCLFCVVFNCDGVVCLLILCVECAQPEKVNGVDEITVTTQQD